MDGEEGGEKKEKPKPATKKSKAAEPVIPTHLLKGSKSKKKTEKRTVESTFS